MGSRVRLCHRNRAPSNPSSSSNKEKRINSIAPSAKSTLTHDPVSRITSINITQKSKTIRVVFARKNSAWNAFSTTTFETFTAAKRPSNAWNVSSISKRTPLSTITRSSISSRIMCVMYVARNSITSTIWRFIDYCIQTIGSTAAIIARALLRHATTWPNISRGISVRQKVSSVVIVTSRPHKRDICRNTSNGSTPIWLVRKIKFNLSSGHFAFNDDLIVILCFSCEFSLIWYPTRFVFIFESRISGLKESLPVRHNPFLSIWQNNQEIKRILLPVWNFYQKWF